MKKFETISSEEIKRRIEIAQFEIKLQKLPRCVRDVKLALLKSMSLGREYIAVPSFCVGCYNVFDSKMRRDYCHEIHVVGNRVIDEELKSYIFGERLDG